MEFFFQGKLLDKRQCYTSSHPKSLDFLSQSARCKGLKCTVCVMREKNTDVKQEVFVSLRVPDISVSVQQMKAGTHTNTKPERP